MTAYSSLAAWYDELTRDVPYPAFADYYEGLFRARGGETGLILDLCCGTGSLACLMAAGLSTAAFAEEMELPLDTVLLLAGPFGGGMGRMREVCGAVSGAIAVLGFLTGYSDPDDSAAKKEMYGRVRELMNAFKERSGSCVCRELLVGTNADDGAVPEERTAGYYRKRPCADLVETAADLCAEILQKYNRSGKKILDFSLFDV